MEKLPVDLIPEDELMLMILQFLAPDLIIPIPYAYQFSLDKPQIQSPEEFLMTAADVLQQNEDLGEAHWDYGGLTGMANGVKLMDSV